MIDTDAELCDLLAAADAEFAPRLRSVRADQWANPTPCTEWTVRDLVNHVVLAELGYPVLLHGGSAGEFIRLQQRDALGADPAAAYERAAAGCQAAFTAPGALQRLVDYPLGQIPGRQLLALRVTERVVHAWDLARGAGLDDTLAPALVDWVHRNLDQIYRGVASGPVSPGGDHRYFAAPPAAPSATGSAQERLLRQMGRSASDQRPGPPRAVPTDHRHQRGATRATGG